MEFDDKFNLHSRCLTSVLERPSIAQLSSILGNSGTICWAPFAFGLRLQHNVKNLPECRWSWQVFMEFFKKAVCFTSNKWRLVRKSGACTKLLWWDSAYQERVGVYYQERYLIHDMWHTSNKIDRQRFESMTSNTGLSVGIQHLHGHIGLAAIHIKSQHCSSCKQKEFTKQPEWTVHNSPW